MFPARPRAGRSANRIYRDARRAWRRAMRLRLLLVGAVASAGALPVWLFAPHGVFFAGMWLGAVWGMLQWIWDEPPHFIARWRTGSEGERQTEKALRKIERDGWAVRHDLSGTFGNLDHVVVGPGGVFLLDTKNLEGVISIDDGVLVCQHPAAPLSNYEMPKLSRSMWGGAKALQRRIKSELGWIADVRPVVVLWAEFAEGEGEIAGVKVIHGSRLSEWLRSQPRRIAEVDHAPVVEAVRALPLAE